MRIQRLFYSGGNYTNTTNAGVFYANGNNNSRTNVNTNIGFRSAQSHTSKAGTPKGYRMVQGIRIRFPYFRKEVKKKNSSNDRLREAVAIRAG
jgi:DNA integrity scanning protein DisA with diadenylate cyclase activity